MSRYTVAFFNEAHQKALGYSPKYSAPEVLSPPPNSLVRVTLKVGEHSFFGDGQNQKLARQAAVSRAVSSPAKLPKVLVDVIDDMMC